VKGLYALGFIMALIVATLRLKYLVEVREAIGGGMKITYRGAPRLLWKAYRDLFKVIREAPRSLVRFSVLASLSAFFVSMVSPFWIIRAKEIVGLSPSQWGTISLVTGATYVVLSFPAGRIVDRFSKKKVLGAALMVTAIPAYFFLYASSFIHVLFILLLITIPNAFINPALQAIFIDMTPPEKRGRMIAALGGTNISIASGAWSIGVLAMISITLGSLLSGYVYSISVSLPWIILTASLIIIGASIITLIEDPKAVESQV